MRNCTRHVCSKIKMTSLVFVTDWNIQLYPTMISDYFTSELSVRTWLSRPLNEWHSFKSICVYMCTEKGAFPAVRLWEAAALFSIRRIAASLYHYGDVIMGMMPSQITSLTVVYSTVYSGVDQSKHQSSASLAFVLGLHRGPVNSPHKGPVTLKMFPFDDVIMMKRGPGMEETSPNDGTAFKYMLVMTQRPLTRKKSPWRHQMDTFPR